ncbi:MAG TPA: zf-HC2 domain-containing protein, partial [Microthrixaceae bacterium]|nr:zf-HC2 domain-containing protein [Microthrixaceae bacterium]
MHVKPCDDWFEDVSAYVDGECDALISAAVEAHLETCARCAATAETMSTIRRRLLLTPAVAHPHLVAAVLGAAPEVGTAAVRSIGGSAPPHWPARGLAARLAPAAPPLLAPLG